MVDGYVVCLVHRLGFDTDTLKTSKRIFLLIFTPLASRSSGMMAFSFFDLHPKLKMTEW